ncbi:MAG: hypothetical protein OXI60_02560 [Acidiferrobacterales bacterium]|nr:hypothetical protein [Acidiferrobacterales bacterium]
MRWNTGRGAFCLMVHNRWVVSDEQIVWWYNLRADISESKLKDIR